MNLNLGALLSLIFVQVLKATTVPPSSLLAGRQFCGFQRKDDYDHTNNQISIDEFPWMVQLLYDETKEILCGGSLINNRYVLTSAHCIHSGYHILTGVRLGDHNVTSDKDCFKDIRFDEECSDPLQEYEIEENIVHPAYNRTTAVNDIGLVRLARKVEYSDYVRPICLPQSESMELKNGQQLVVSGWGYINHLGSQTEVKKKVLTTIIPLHECQEMYKDYRKSVSINNICATERNVFTCQGDSGGPLMYSIKNQWEQVGILAFGKACGLPAPTVYLKVSSYVDWIVTNLRP